MAKVLVTPQAEADLQEIWLTIAIDNPTAADRLLRRIGKKLDFLGEFPEMGRQGRSLRHRREYSWKVTTLFSTNSLGNPL